MLPQWVSVGVAALGAWLKEVDAAVYGSGQYENGGIYLSSATFFTAKDLLKIILPS